MTDNIINDCYKKSIALLLKNSSKYGILACSPQKKALERNYLSIFARDASICSMGMVATKNKQLTTLTKLSLTSLAKFQANNGEIPNYIKPEIACADFWKIACIDATLWWLLAIDFYDKNTNDASFKKSLMPNINKALTWLACQEHNNDALLRQNEASDWGDIMPRSGKVLYSNALWYKVKKAYNLDKQEKTSQNFNLLFHPYDYKKDIPYCSSATVTLFQKTHHDSDFYLSFVNYLYWGEDVDILGNSLAMLGDLPDKVFALKIIDYISKKKVLAGFPIPVLFNPITENSPLWRKYMENHRQNYPYQYHNGGTWPFASCFYAMCLKKYNQNEKAKEELNKIAHLNKANNWQFNEWFHSKTGHAHGMHGQSWNAGAFLLAYHYIYNDLNF